MNETTTPRSAFFDDAARGAHETVDRLAHKAAPVAQQLSAHASAAENMLHEKTDQLRHTRDEWVEGARSTVRGNPLVFVAAAMAVGALAALIALTGRDTR